MRRVLVVSPNWPPLSFPDLHRARASLPYYRDFGWDPVVLAVDPALQEGMRDPDLSRTVPADVPVHLSGTLPRGLTAWAGLRDAKLRAFLHLAREGRRIIERERIDLVFLTTTIFPLFALGPYWRRATGVPYVLDFQDPWLAGAEEGRKGRRSLRSRLVRAAARVLEPACVERAAGVMCVSPAYATELRRHYPALRGRPVEVIPFGGAEGDVAAAERLDVRNPLFDPDDGKRHWVYVGRGGADMGTAARGLFRALRRMKELRPGLTETLRLHFIGTAYAPDDPTLTFEPLAREAGVADLVRERPGRIPYFEALRCLRDAHALIVLGSDDPGYMPSKIFPYLAMEKPLLAVVHEGGPLAAALQETRGGTIVTFGPTGAEGDLAAAIHAAWMASDDPPAPTPDRLALERYSSREATRRQCELFDRVAATP